MRRTIRERTILFLDEDNACLSQMAEAVAKHLDPPTIRVFSAGLKPTAIPPQVHKVMEEMGISLSGQAAKKMNDIPLGEIDLVVSFNDADKKCGTLPATVKVERWPIHESERPGGRILCHHWTTIVCTEMKLINAYLPCLWTIGVTLPNGDSPLKDRNLTAMNIYLLRHGIAIEREDPSSQTDADRPLTAKGLKRMRKAARGLRRLNIPFDAVVTSPFARARQTADIVAAALGLQPTFEEISDLTPEGTVESLLSTLARFQSHSHLLLVGHEPLLSDLAAFLLTLEHPDEFGHRTEKRRLVPHRGGCIATPPLRHVALADDT